ncbi:MAG: mechanosensitive ion channel family protein [Actinomycetota bacterium]
MQRIVTWRSSAGGRLAQDDVDAIAEAFDTDGLDAWAWITAGITLAVAILLAIVVRWSLTRLLDRRLDRALAVLISRLVGYVVVTVGLAYALESLGVQIGPLLGALGIAGIALAFALKDILENFVAGVMLQIRRPFTYGDEVEIAEQQGRVEEIDARLVTIVTPSGETVLVPSAAVIKSEVTNLSARGARRTDVPIGVAYGTDLRRARQVLLDAVRELDGVHGDPAPQVLLTGFGDSSIDFVVRYWHGPAIATFWQVRSDVAFAVDAALAEADITIPFPQRTLWWAGDTDA